MASAWQELRDINRELAFLLLFAPARKRDIMADLFLLGYELENAAHIPNEPMLAAIRLQWWHDALAQADHSSVPLVQRFQNYYTNSTLAPVQVVGIVSNWQNYLADETTGSQGCWAACWSVAADISLGNKEQVAGTIGAAFMQMQRQPEQRSTPPHIPDWAGSDWLAMAVHLINHWTNQPQSSGEDQLLIWRMLAWRMGFTPRRSTL